MFESVEALVAEYAELESRLADPAIHTDQTLSRRLGRRYAELRPVIETYRSWKQAGDDAAAARELGADDPAFRAEAESLLAEQAELAEGGELGNPAEFVQRLNRLLVELAAAHAA